jgi:hypothetical protein
MKINRPFRIERHICSKASSDAFAAELLAQPFYGWVEIVTIFSQPGLAGFRLSFSMLKQGREGR